MTTKNKTDYLMSLFFLLPAFLIVRLNPQWLDNFTATEKRILDDWNGVSNIHLKTFLLNLASPFLLFDDNRLTVDLPTKDGICAVLTTAFAVLFGFLGALLFITAYLNPNADGLPYLICLATALALSAIGFCLATAEKYAAFIIRKFL